MVFSSMVFVSLFLPIVFLLNHWLSVRTSNIFLLACSLILYAWGEPLYVLLLIGVALCNYGAAFVIVRRPRLGLALTLTINIGVLFTFKYLGFAANAVASLVGGSASIDIQMPIGVSFYTFQAMSYVLDVKRGACAPQRSLPKLMLYISLFPQLIAGPIVKYGDIEPYLSRRNASARDVARGFRRFCLGMAKKVLLANVLARAADLAFSLPTGEISTAMAWLGAAAYALQIYYDFSGYSDMAIGIGLSLGFHFRENFAHPYAAASMRDFWRRWHISLSSWFREYVYIPLGGNRRGPRRTTINRLAVFLLTGLWHGANWTFVVWGLINGILVSLEGLIRPVDRARKFTRWAGRAYVILMCVCLFALFRSDSLQHAFSYLARMFTLSGATHAQRAWMAGLIDGHMIFTLLAAIICAADWTRVSSALSAYRFAAPCAYVCSLALMALSLFALASQAYNPFIYFRF